MFFQTEKQPDFDCTIGNDREAMPDSRLLVFEHSPVLLGEVVIHRQVRLHPGSALRLKV